MYKILTVHLASVVLMALKRRVQIKIKFICHIHTYTQIYLSHSHTHIVYRSIVCAFAFLVKPLKKVHELRPG